MLVVLLGCCILLPQPALGAEVRLNQIQVLHWHNTYHICPAPWLSALAKS